MEGKYIEKETLLEKIEKKKESIEAQISASYMAALKDCIKVIAAEPEISAVILPVELGTTVYCLGQPCGGCKNFNEPMQEEFIKECQNCDKWDIIPMPFDYDLIPEWGKTVFKTKEEATKALDEKINIAEK